MLSTNSSSDVPSTPSTKSETAGQIAISSKRLGDLAEQWVAMLAAWKAPRSTRTCGLRRSLIQWGDKIVQVDVGSTFNKTYWHAKNHTVQDPVYPLVVEPDGDIANWRVKWQSHRTPEGWEDFWSKDYRTVSTKPNESA